MPRLRDKNLTPAGGWVYLNVETDLWLKGDNWLDLVAKVKAHRTYKGLSNHGIEIAIETQLCETLGEQWCRANKGETWNPLENIGKKIGIKQLASLSAFILEWIKSGESIVSKDISSERATICRKCPVNRPLSQCACTPFYKAVNALVPEYRKEKDLHVCGICGCSLPAKVLMPQSVIQKDNSNKKLKYPNGCWQNEDKTN